jgi:hypothetical protein
MGDMLRETLVLRNIDSNNIERSLLLYDNKEEIKYKLILVYYETYLDPEYKFYTVLNGNKLGSGLITLLNTEEKRKLLPTEEEPRATEANPGKILLFESPLNSRNIYVLSKVNEIKLFGNINDLNAAIINDEMQDDYSISEYSFNSIETVLPTITLFDDG